MLRTHFLQHCLRVRALPDLSTRNNRPNNLTRGYGKKLKFCQFDAKTIVLESAPVLIFWPPLSTVAANYIKLCRVVDSTRLRMNSI